jgi:hypothetical protein
MRGVLAVLTFSAFLVQAAFAQGVKDPANFPGSYTQDAKKTQTAHDPRNQAAGNLPAGRAVQRVWKDGKLIAVPR